MTNKLMRKMKDRAKANTQNMDFQKKKTKLGKKPVSAAATKTLFQSKVLHMPSQSMTEDKGEMVTSRNLTLKDLLTQLSHYSESVRKDALIGVKEILTKFPHLLALHLGAILEKILNTITDGDPAVRQALVALLEFVIPQFELETLSAYFPIIRVYLLAGLTRDMYNTVRMTALSMVELWLNHFPSVIVPIADQLLPTYIVVLQSIATPAGPAAANTTRNTTTKKAPTVQERQVVLNNLKKLLAALAQHHTSSDSSLPRNFQSRDMDTKSKSEVPVLIWGSSQKNEILMNQDYAIFLERQAAFFPHTYTTTTSASQLESAEPSTPSHYTSHSAPTTPSTPPRPTASTPATPATPRAPTSLSAPVTPASPATSATPSTPSTPTQPDAPTTPSQSSSSHSLTPTSDATDSWQFLRDFFKKLFPLLMANWVELITSPHVTPVTATSSPSSNTLQTTVNKSDLPYLEVMDTLLQILNFALGLLGESGKIGKQSDIEKYMVAHFPFHTTATEVGLDINVHLCNIFSHFLDSSLKSEQHELITTMIKFTIQQFTNATQVQAYSHKLIGLLPVLRKLLTCVGNTTAQQLLQAFTTFDENSHPHSAAKRACVEFLSEILQAHQSQTSLYKPSDKIASAGLLSFPKLLFKLSTHNLSTTEAILKALVLFGKGRSNIFESVQPPLIPFFFTLLKVSAKHPKGARVFGPFVHLPPSHQQQALDLVYFFPSISPQMEKALLACCLHESVPAETVSRAIQIFEHHYERKRDTSLEHYVAFLVSLQVGMGLKVDGSRGAGTKRKRMEEADEVMEVEKDGKEVTREAEEESTNEEERNKEDIVPEKIMEVSKTICWSFGMLSGTEGADRVMGMLLNILTSTLEGNTTEATKYCVMQLVSSIYSNVSSTTWRERGGEALPQSLEKLFPSVIADYLLSVFHPELKQLASCAYSIFELWPNILAAVLSLFSDQINTKEQNKFWQAIEVVLMCISAPQLETALLHNKCKVELFKVVKMLKDPRFSSERANTTILGKICSEVEILYGSTEAT